MEWLKPDTSPYLKERFNIDRFDYAVAILIDLTGDKFYSNLWISEMRKKEDNYLKDGVNVRFIWAELTKKLKYVYAARLT